MTTILVTSVWNPATRPWEAIATEHADGLADRDLSTVTISAEDIGGEPGQPCLIEVRDEDGNVFDAIEIEST